MFLRGIKLNKDLANNLFEALAILDRPLSNACEKAIDYAKDVGHLSEIEKKEIIDASKLLITGHQYLHMYLSRRYPDLDFIAEGESLYKEIKAKNNVFQGD